MGRLRRADGSTDRCHILPDLRLCDQLLKFALYSAGYRRDLGEGHGQVAACRRAVSADAYLRAVKAALSAASMSLK
jgi:hypothetical protein